MRRSHGNNNESSGSLTRSASPPSAVRAWNSVRRARRYARNCLCRIPPAAESERDRNERLARQRFCGTHAPRQQTHRLAAADARVPGGVAPALRAQVRQGFGGDARVARRQAADEYCRDVAGLLCGVRARSKRMSTLGLIGYKLPVPHRWRETTQQG